MRWSGIDTRNPPRAIGTDGIFDYLCEQLPGFRIELTDHGAGAVSLLAVRGETTRVFNVHLDTVPSSPAWTADPLRLRVTDDRAIGLGACDIKGAAACLLAAAEVDQGTRRHFCSPATKKPTMPVAWPPSSSAITASPRQSSPSRPMRRPCWPIAASSRCAWRSRARAGHASARQCARAERRAPGDALGRSFARPRGLAVAPALRRADRVAIQHRAHRRRHQGQRHRPGRGAAFWFPAVAFAEPRRNCTRPFAASPIRPSLDAYEETFQGPCLPAGDIATAEDAAPAGARPGRRARTCRSATRSTSGPKPRFFPLPDSPRWCTDPAISPRRTPPMNG